MLRATAAAKAEVSKLNLESLILNLDPDSQTPTFKPQTTNPIP